MVSLIREDPPGFIRSVKHNKPHRMTRQGQKSSSLWEVPGDLPIRDDIVNLFAGNVIPAVGSQ